MYVDLIAQLKAVLGDQVKDIRLSSKLTDSPVCLVADEGDMDIAMEQLMAQRDSNYKGAPRILEINPDIVLTIDSPDFTLGKEIAPCTVEISNTFESLHAHVRFNNGAIIYPNKVAFVKRMKVKYTNLTIICSNPGAKLFKEIWNLRKPSKNVEILN